MLIGDDKVMTLLSLSHQGYYVSVIFYYNNHTQTNVIQLNIARIYTLYTESIQISWSFAIFETWGIANYAK